GGVDAECGGPAHGRRARCLCGAPPPRGGARAGAGRSRVHRRGTTRRRARGGGRGGGSLWVECWARRRARPARLGETIRGDGGGGQVTVICGEATPSYRIRGYMAAHVEGRRTHIGWVWDVYDADKHRVLRIADEEPGGRAGADAWNAADEAMLRRIARTGMD